MGQCNRSLLFSFAVPKHTLLEVSFGVLLAESALHHHGVLLQFSVRTNCSCVFNISSIWNIPLPSQFHYLVPCFRRLEKDTAHGGRREESEGSSWRELDCCSGQGKRSLAEPNEGPWNAQEDFGDCFELFGSKAWNEQPDGEQMLHFIDWGISCLEQQLSGAILQSSDKPCNPKRPFAHW